jgi:SAM-dependent methyltransferase
MKQSVKDFLLQTSPRLASALQRASARRHVRRLERRIGLTRVRDAFVARHGLVVLDGPFRGMRYVDRAVGSMAIPKLVGSYEAELHDWVHAILRRGYRRVIDVGCAEGYYAVGLARELPGGQVLAFDTDPLARRLCAAMARLNGVDGRVQVFGRCDATRLNETLNSGTLVVSDCEGFEAELLDPAVAPRLIAADVLVELHDALRPGVTDLLLQRFRPTHECAVVGVSPRDPSGYASTSFLPPDDQRLAVSEMRSGDQRWAFLTSRSAA